MPNGISMKQPYKVMSWLSTLGPGTQSMWILFGTGNLYKYILRFVQIHFAICTNTFCMLYKYILYVVQIHFVICTNTFCNVGTFNVPPPPPGNPASHFRCLCYLSLYWNYTFAKIKVLLKHLHLWNWTFSKYEFVHLPPYLPIYY